MLEKFTMSTPINLSSTDKLCGLVALFVLANFREQKAFPLIVNLCKLSPSVTECLLEAIISEYTSQHLSATYHKDLKSLCDIVTNLYFCEYSRSAALKAIVILYRYDRISREEILAVFLSFFDALYNDFTHVPSVLVSSCCQIHAIELRDQIDKYVEKNVLDAFFFSLEWMEEKFLLSREEALSNLQSNSCYKINDDLYDTMEWLFEKDEDSSISAKPEIDEEEYDIPEKPKIGRNTPC
jgi:hypothetical protein